MVKILGFSGQKGSGKSTSSNFIHGYQMKAFGVIDDFALTTDGELVAETNNDGQQLFTKLDVSRTDPEFIEWAAFNMWPYVKRYSFAQPLKTIAMELFGLTYEQCYGTDEQKNTKTHLKWSDMPKVYTGKRTPVKRGKMTAREFMQFFGTEICRKMYSDVWTNYLIKTIESEAPLLAVIDDVRFDNEVEAIQGAGGKVVRLTRQPFDDAHSSETALNDYDGFDAFIQNENMEILDANREIVALLSQWEWFGEIPVEPELQSTQPSRPQHVGGVTQIKRA